MEIWKKHKEFNYEISNYGNIRRIGEKYINKGGVEKTKRTKILKPRLVGRTTFQVALCKTENKTNKVTFFSVNKLVAEYFLPKPKGDEILLEHKDGNFKNNKASNLRWITRKQWNLKHKGMIKRRTELSQKIRKENREKRIKNQEL